MSTIARTRSHSKVKRMNRATLTWNKLTAEEMSAVVKTLVKVYNKLPWQK